MLGRTHLVNPNQKLTVPTGSRQHTTPSLLTSWQPKPVPNVSRIKLTEPKLTEPKITESQSMSKTERRILETQLYVDLNGGLRAKYPVTMAVSPTTIEFQRSPFQLKDEIKALKGAKWMGFHPTEPKKVWTADNCARNWFQLKYLMGQNPYEWFDRELIKHEFRDFPSVLDKKGKPCKLMSHQAHMVNVGLTYHYQIWGAEMGTGKTLSAQTLMEMSGQETWFWVGPLKSLENIEREFEKWDCPLSLCIPKDGASLLSAVRANEHNIYMTTYERLLRYMAIKEPDERVPGGVIFDESSRLKTPTAQRTKAAMQLADDIRTEYKEDGFVILMSGTPSPKSPLDWWSQCEIAWPGYLREGSKGQLQKTLAFMVLHELPDNIVNVQIGWKDNDKKCAKCADMKGEGAHVYDPDNPDQDRHVFVKSKNEVAYMYDRLAGLATIIHKKDVLDLPPKVYEIDICEPSASTMRVAKHLAASAPNVMTGITWLRELSDGFMYKEIADGVRQCPTCAGSPEDGQVKVWRDPDSPGECIRAIDMLDQEYVDTLEEGYDTCPSCKGTRQVPKKTRVAKMVPCPKEKALKNRLAQCEETGRIVIFAGFQGSIDRIKGICKKSGWDVVQCDGRGWQVIDKTGKKVQTNKPLSYWADREHHQQVAFVAHPASGGLSLNLTEARMIVYWSNDFNPESRSQSEDRIHRKGMSENHGAKIVDLYHLPSDEHVHTVLKANRKLELMTLGELFPDAPEVKKTKG